jgi:hypothetical protein
MCRFMEIGTRNLLERDWNLIKKAEKMMRQLKSNEPDSAPPP